jgi:hypothetical protein
MATLSFNFMFVFSLLLYAQIPAVGHSSSAARPGQCAENRLGSTPLPGTAHGPAGAANRQTALDDTIIAGGYSKCQPMKTGAHPPRP